MYLDGAAAPFCCEVAPGETDPVSLTPRTGADGDFGVEVYPDVHVVGETRLWGLGSCGSHSRCVGARMTDDGIGKMCLSMGFEE